MKSTRPSAVLFDRDGTLTVDRGYTYKVEDLAWAPGAIDAIRACNDAGWLAIVVTNQSGIARGYFGEAEMRAFHDAMQRDLSKHGAHIDAFHHCPFHEDGVVDAYKVANHPDRKPNPGMLRRAVLEWSIHPARCLMVGDTDADVAAARAARIEGARVRQGELLHAVVSAIQNAATAPASDIDAPTLLRDRAAQARAWVFDHAAPLWWEAGFDRQAGLFHERIALDGTPVASMGRRVRVQARQTYVYATMGRLGWNGPWREAVDAGVQVLLTKAMRADGGCVHMLDPQGAITDARRDLYDLAFVVFALAHAADLTRDKSAAIEAATSLLSWIEAEWADPHGGFQEGDISPTPPRRQNPHMHLFEACLALHAVTKDKAHLTRAERLATLFAMRLYDPRTTSLAEYFAEDWSRAPGAEGHIVEPGHHFEWSWLLHQLRKAGGADYRAHAEQLRLHAEVYGVRPTGSVVYDEVYANGAPRTQSSRLWPHTERLKAHLARFEHAGDISAAAAAVEAFDALQRYLDTPIAGLWRDRLLPDGTFVEEAAPASSLYHILLAYAELIRVSGLA